ncbi:hypothetical protein BH23CHL2_BH23CHL2_09740 [soil metagenome]
MEDRDLIPLKEAQDILGVSHTTMARLVREGRFTIYQNPLDRRQKLVHIAEVRAAARPVPVAQDRSGDEEHEDSPRQRTGPIPIRQPRLPGDDQFRAAFELLRLLNEAHRTDTGAPFIHTQNGDVLHPAFHEGRITVPKVRFDRLVSEGLIRVLSGVYHRRGPDVGREFVITQAGYDALERR